MIRHKLAVLKAFLLQQYYNLKSYDETPFRMIAGEFGDNRTVVPVPVRRQTSKNQK